MAIFYKRSKKTEENGHIIPNVASPPSIAAHNTSKANKFSGNRRVTREILKRIHTSTGIVVPLGAPICTLCRKKLATIDTSECKEYEGRALALVEEVHVHEEPEIVSRNHCTDHTEQELESVTDYSSCEPESQSQNLSQISEASACAVEKREILNAFLSLSNLSPVKEKRSLKDSSSKTQSNCITKALQCIEAICDTICPGEGKLLEDKVRSTIYSQMKDKEKVSFRALIIFWLLLSK